MSFILSYIKKLIQDKNKLTLDYGKDDKYGSYHVTEDEDFKKYIFLINKCDDSIVNYKISDCIHSLDDENDEKNHKILKLYTTCCIDHTHIITINPCGKLPFKCTCDNYMGSLDEIELCIHTLECIIKLNQISLNDLFELNIRQLAIVTVEMFLVRLRLLNEDIDLIKDKNKNNDDDDFCLICYDKLFKEQIVKSCQQNHTVCLKCFDGIVSQNYGYYECPYKCSTYKPNFSLYKSDKPIITKENEKSINNIGIWFLNRKYTYSNYEQYVSQLPYITYNKEVSKNE